MTKESTHQEDISVIRPYAPNNIDAKNVNQKKIIIIELKGEIDKSTAMIGDIYSSFSIVDRSTRQRKGYRRVPKHSQPIGYNKHWWGTQSSNSGISMLFSSSDGTFTKTDHIPL